MNLPPIPITATKVAAASITNINGRCSNCGSNNRWLLHNVLHRGIDRRLCTSCVLRLHPSSFCPFCFEYFDPPLSTTSASADRVVSCGKCPCLAHIQCLPSPLPSPKAFLCPPCLKPNFSFFEIRKSDSKSTNTSLVLDKKLADALLCAAKIASASMNKAVNMARAKADRSVREAVLARKRAKEALEHFFAVDKAKRTESSMVVSGSGNLGTKDKEKIPKVPNPGLKVMCKKEDFDGFIGQNKVPSASPHNGVSVTVQYADKKNGASDLGAVRDSCFSGVGTTIVKDKSGNDGKLGNHEADFERL